jgi:hypothetical protein
MQVDKSNKDDTKETTHYKREREREREFFLKKKEIENGQGAMIRKSHHSNEE